LIDWSWLLADKGVNLPYSLMGQETEKQKLSNLFPSHHLWLMPSGKIYDRLVTIIKGFSKKYGGPFFEPHVTLLGFLPGTQEEIMAHCLTLAKTLQPFEIRLANLGCHDTYFQCLYLNVGGTEEIIKANSQAKRAFQTSGSSEFTPHLSLLYGDYPRAIKDQIISSLGEDLRFRFDITEIHLIHAESEDPKQWGKIQRFQLVGVS
jgi:2'-5' RNA ligase